MLRRELSILRPPLYSMSPSFLNLFMKKFTRPRVVPDHFRKRLLGDLRCLSLRTGLLAVTREQQKRSGDRFSLGLKSWSTRSASMRMFLATRRLLPTHIAGR